MYNVGISTFVWTTESTLLIACISRLFYQEIFHLGQNPSFVTVMYFKTS